jgi:hypothetical protein
VAVYRSRLASLEQTIPPFEEVIACYGFELEICNQIIVDDGFESPLGFARGVGAPVAEQIR